MALWHAKTCNVCATSPIFWSSPDNSQASRVPKDAFPDVDASSTRVLFDSLHEEMILIRGSQPKEVFLSNKATQSWYSFKINLEDSPNILDACFSSDLTLLALRTSDKEVRIIDCISGEVAKVRSSRETSVSMLAVHWVSSLSPDPYFAAAQSAAVARAYKRRQEMLSQEGWDKSGGSPVSPTGGSSPTNVEDNVALTFEASRVPQDILFVRSAGIEFQRIEDGKLKWIETFATDVVDHWIVHEQNILLTHGNTSEFLLFKINPKSTSPLTKICRFDMNLMERPSSPMATNQNDGKESEDDEDDEFIASGTDHGVVTPSGETIAVGVGLSNGGMTHGRGNVAIGKNRKERCRLSTVVLYGKLYLALVDEINAQLFLLTLNAEGDSFEQTHVLPLHLPGRFVVLAVDNVLVAMSLRERVVFLFDVRSRRPEAIAAPLPLGFSSELYTKFKVVEIDETTPTVSSKAANDAKRRSSFDSADPRIPLELHNNWIFQGPRYLINTSSSGSAGAIYSIDLHLAALSAHWPLSKRVSLADFLLKRTGVRAKLILMRVIRSFIVNGGPAAIALVSRLFAVFAAFLLDQPTEFPLTPSDLTFLADCLPSSKAVQLLAQQQRHKVAELIRATFAQLALHPSEIAAKLSLAKEGNSNNSQNAPEVDVSEYVSNTIGTSTKSGPSRSLRARDVDLGGEGSPASEVDADAKGDQSPVTGGETLSSPENEEQTEEEKQGQVENEDSTTAVQKEDNPVSLSEESDLLPPPSPLTLPLPPLLSSLGEPFSKLLFCLYTPSGHHIVTQLDLYYHVFLPLLHGFIQRPHAEMSLELLPDADCDAKVDNGLERVFVKADDLIPIIVEFVRALARHKLKIDPAINELLFAALVAAGKYVSLHMFLQYHIISDSPLIAERLIELSTSYQPAYQLGLDMLYRLGASPRLLQIHLQQGLVTQALQLVSPKSNAFERPNVRPRDFLNVALRSRNKVTFYSAYRYFEERNLLMNGSVEFPPSEQCGFAVRAFQRLHSESFNAIVDDLLKEIGEL